MINEDEDALICDLAETYQIYNYRSLPCKTVATFSCGLRNDSRIKMKLSKSTITLEEMLLSAVVDNTNLLAWMQSADGVKGTNRPKSLLSKFIGMEEDNDEIVAFESGEEFDRAWANLTGKEV